VLWVLPSSANSYLSLDLPASGKWKPLLNEIYDLEGSWSSAQHVDFGRLGTKTQVCVLVPLHMTWRSNYRLDWIPYGQGNMRISCVHSKILFHPDPISARLWLHNASCEINHDSAQSLTYLEDTRFCCEPCFSPGSWTSLVSPNAEPLGCGSSLQTASLATLPLMTWLQGSS
jgi:hypothetical protein